MFAVSGEYKKTFEYNTTDVILQNLGQFYKLLEKLNKFSWIYK